MSARFLTAAASAAQNLQEQVASGFNVDWFGTVRGRLGYAFDKALIYGTGGFAFGGGRCSVYTNSTSPLFPAFLTSSKDETLTGWAAGAGIEYQLTPAWSAKFEYQHLDLGDMSVNGAVTTLCQPGFNFNCPFHSKHEVGLDTVRVGINYHLGQDYIPLK